jgi:hypothetical protein
LQLEKKVMLRLEVFIYKASTFCQRGFDILSTWLEHFVFQVLRHFVHRIRNKKPHPVRIGFYKKRQRTEATRAKRIGEAKAEHADPIKKRTLHQ